jgi:hypothetical protein
MFQAASLRGPCPVDGTGVATRQPDRARDRLRARMETGEVFIAVFKHAMTVADQRLRPLGPERVRGYSSRHAFLKSATITLRLAS